MERPCNWQEVGMSRLREWFFGACAALCLVLAGPRAFAADGTVKLPDTAAGRHAGAWLEAVGSGDEVALRWRRGRSATASPGSGTSGSGRGA